MHEQATSDSVHQQFAYGLRFVTELVYRVQLPNGRTRHRRLLPEPSPLVPHEGDESGARTCVALATAILTQARVRPILLNEPLDANDTHEADQVASTLCDHLPAHEVQVRGPEQLPDWGHFCAAALRSNGLALLQLIEKSGIRWSLVVGLEWREVNGVPSTETLAMLLMDVNCSPVWGVGHNARFDPGGPLHPHQARSSQMLQLRTLDGGLIPVRPKTLITVRRQAPVRIPQ